MVIGSPICRDLLRRNRHLGREQCSNVQRNNCLLRHARYGVETQISFIEIEQSGVVCSQPEESGFPQRRHLLSCIRITCVQTACSDIDCWPASSPGKKDKKV